MYGSSLYSVLHLPCLPGRRPPPRGAMQGSWRASAGALCPQSCGYQRAQQQQRCLEGKNGGESTRSDGQDGSTQGQDRVKIRSKRVNRDNARSTTQHTCHSISLPFWSSYHSLRWQRRPPRTAPPSYRCRWCSHSPPRGSPAARGQGGGHCKGEREGCTCHGS